MDPLKSQEKDSCTDACCTPKESSVKKSFPILLINPPSATKTDSCCQDDACCGEVPAEKTDSITPLTGKINEFRVQGMDCPACARTIEKSLGKVKGVNQVNVNYSTGKMQIAIEDDSVLETIPSHIKKIGFTVEPLVQNGNVQAFNIEGMDCGACAVTLEKHMKNLSNVKEVNVNFSTGRMQIKHEMNVEDVIKEVSKVGYQASLISNRRTNTETNEPKKDYLTTISGVLLALGILGSFTESVLSVITTLIFASVVVISGYKPAKNAFYAIKSGSLDMNVLMASAAIGAGLIGQWSEGATVVWLFAFGTMLQNKSVDKTRNSIRNLMNLAPSEAWVKQNGELIRKPVEDISIGNTIVVKPGEKIPLDGEVIQGSSTVNQAPITGESIPVDKEIGDTVYAGTINESGSLELKVTKLVEDTAIARIIHMVEEAQEKKAPTQDFVDRFARIYTPIVFTLAILIMVLPPLLGFGGWLDWIYKGLELLVIACPCALVISTPVAIVSSIGNAAKNGVLIKGGSFLEIAGALKAIAFDKTGTLTEGKPKVSQVITLKGTEEEMLAIARTIEEHSKHPIALAIRNYAIDRNIEIRNGETFKAIVGKGAHATIDGVEYYAGNPKLFNGLGVDLGNYKEQVQTLQNEGNTLVIIGTKTTILGIIAVSDTVREISVNALKELKEMGIEQVVMLTGDNEGTAKKIAQQIGVDRYFAELLPEDKVNAVKQLQQEGKLVAMVGDGINDAPALATANLGIAMGGAGTDTAMETADIVLMADNLEKLPHTMKLSRKAMQIIRQNIWFSILVKVVALMLIFPGWLTLWIAVMSDTGAALLVILNSMRLLALKAETIKEVKNDKNYGLSKNVYPRDHETT
ncbi:heavy metal translocating P-type ATPase [Bacillus sp. ISL-46]|uniref:heavy metal translocating P-type ATPase n=1 Tax=Bacillus sp. ISL-46 TaxID=2819129 RepID=UPI001BE7FB5C|nr:cadmium-translocating P-type ATPase [Bacillus sp. ISL-46]